MSTQPARSPASVRRTQIAPSKPATGTRRRLGVLLIDELPVVRAGMAMLIDDRPDMDVLGEAGTAEEALQVAQRVRRSCVVALVGLGLPGEHDTFWLIREVRRRFPTFAILGFGAQADAMTISRALFMGADGFVDAHLDPIAFFDAIREAIDGDLVLAGEAAELVGEIADGLERRREAAVRLTDREREVLTVAAEGLTARQIADRLGVRERTITTHLARIYGKLGVGTRLAAIRAASRSGLAPVGTTE